MTRFAALVTSVALTVVTASAGTPPQRISGGTFEASGVIHVPGTNGALFVDDGSKREVFWIEIEEDGALRGPARPVPLTGTSITDLEGITFDGRRVYIVGSQSKTTGVDGDGLARFTFNPTTRQVADIERIQGVKAWLAEQVPELRGTARKLGDHVLNIEAIAWDPRGSRLLLGLRAPVVDGQALIIPIGFRDLAGPFATRNLVVGTTIRLPLQGAGIRSLEYDARAERFRLISGAGLNDETRDFRILEWDGTSPSVREVSRYARTLKPEGLTSGIVNGRPSTILVFDTGRYALLD